MNIINKFNSPETFLVISDYPENNSKGQKNHGIAWYTSEFTREIARKYKQKFVVLAEKNGVSKVNKSSRFCGISPSMPISQSQWAPSLVRPSPRLRRGLVDTENPKGSRNGHLRLIPDFASPAKSQVLLPTTSLYDHQKTLVLRVFDKDHPTLFPRILKWLFTFNRIKNVHVHSEFCADGGIFNMILLLPFLLMIKLTGRRVTFFAHNVADDLTTIAPHLNLNIHSFSFLLLNKLIPLYYKIINLITDEIVVLDESIKKRLLRYISPKAVTTLPLWSVKKDYRASKKQSREKLGLSPTRFTLIYFGFITYYKGADWLVDTVKKLLSEKKFSHLTLIMAGGPAHSLSHKPHYQRFYNNILDEATGEDRIKITGFIDEKDIGLYMTAADLCVFPYRDMIGASGSLSHALSYKKPFIVSDKMLDGLIQNPDFENICKKIGITTRYPMFSGFNSFRRLISKLQKTKSLNKLKLLSRKIAENQKIDAEVKQAYIKLILPYKLNRKGAKAYELAKAGV